MTGVGQSQAGQGAPKSPAEGVPPSATATESGPRPRESAPTAAALTGQAPPALRTNAIGLSVLGFVGGRLRLTYERMLTLKHGVFAEGILAPDLLNGSDFVSYGGALGYRFHWRARESSGFVGATLALEHGSGSMKVQDFRKDETYHFAGSGTRLSISPHIGKRWVFNHGVNLTVRIGAGYSQPWVSPSAKADAKATQLLESLHVNVEGELSAGYTF